MPETTIRAETRMVVVDVIVKGKRGAATNLLQADFEILEDGKLQSIRSFQHSGATATKPVEAVVHQPLPAGVYSNELPARSAGPPPMIVLLDVLNTSPPDRERARQAMVDFLRTQVKPDQRIAVLSLGHQLLLLQNFTADKAALSKASLVRVQNPADPMMRHRDSDLMETVASVAGDDLSGGLKKLIETLKKYEDQENMARTSSRVETTVTAMKALARMVEGMPGRKSLIWISAGFPFFIDNRAGLANFEEPMKDAARALNSAQIAVYPIDVRGLIGGEFVQIDLGANIEWARNPRTFDEKLTRNRREMRDPHETMKDIAEQTGGKAFYNRNDIEHAIADAANDSDDYYSIGYYPANRKYDGKYRKIEVRLRQKGFDARYRSGYFADDVSAKAVSSRLASGEKELKRAIDKDPVTSSQVVFLARLEPASPVAEQPFKLEFFVKGTSLEFFDQDSQFVTKTTFGVSVHKQDGSVVFSKTESRESTLSTEQRDKVLRSGLLFSIPVTLSKGTYTIRAGVRDNATGRIGTLDFQVIVP